MNKKTKKGVTFPFLIGKVLTKIPQAIKAAKGL